MNPADDDFESDHYFKIIENFLYERGVEPEDTSETTQDLLDILLLNGWEITAL